MSGNKKISQAISNGDIETLKGLIGKDQDVFSYIVLAIEHEQFKTAKFLIKKCANLDKKIIYTSIKSGMPVFNYEERTLLMWAIIEDHLDIAKLLIKQGASTEVTDKYKMTALHNAAQFGCVKGVKFLIEQNAEIEARSKGNYTPLMLALEKPTPYYVKNYALETIFEVYYSLDDENLEAAAQLLLDAGADFTLKDKNNNTALHSAASLGAADITLFLIEQGLDINARGEEKETPLERALGNFKEKSALVLLSKGAAINEDSLWKAAKISGALVEKVIEKGGEVNKPHRGRSPLHFAAHLGIADAVKVLLEHNAEVNAKDKSEHTPLYTAVNNEEEYLETVKLLVEAGADINTRSGDTPYRLAKKNKLKNICRFMREQTQTDERSINESEAKYLKNEFFKAVRKAIKSKLPFYIEYFISCEANVDINSTNSLGKTALHMAAEKGCLTVVTFLVQNGADIHKKTRKGEVAADLAPEPEKVYDDVAFFFQYQLPTLKKEVSAFASLLYSPVTDDDLREAASYLEKHKKLRTSVTSRELAYFERSDDDSIQELGEKIEAARDEKLYNTSTGCSLCGRDTLAALRHEHTSGSPSTPNYEAEYYYRCASCGNKDSFSF
ncbi:MAG: hypothetical protein GY754_27415 [bacterium]|nr:hypothetical protein [bacterium]